MRRVHCVKLTPGKDKQWAVAKTTKKSFRFNKMRGIYELSEKMLFSEEDVWFVQVGLLNPFTYITKHILFSFLLNIKLAISQQYLRICYIMHRIHDYPVPFRQI
jgi:hypothetical protein